MHARTASARRRRLRARPTSAQVERANGSVVTHDAGLAPLLDRAASHCAGVGTRFTTGPARAGRRMAARSRTVRRPGRRGVLVVGHLAARGDAAPSLREFLLAAPAALVLTLLAGYGLAAAALRPVEAMRRRAAAIRRDAGAAAARPARGDEISRLCRDPERDAREARGRFRARAAVRVPTRATSCARPSRCCARSSSSRSAAALTRRSSRRAAFGGGRDGAAVARSRGACC